jgi:hypothetical protein
MPHFRAGIHQVLDAGGISLMNLTSFPDAN